MNWLRHDTSIFHDSFPATEDNVKRVILELERFPGCYMRASDTFNVDQVAEWVRVNAAPFAEKMEPPPFLEAPIPDAAEEEEAAPAPPGAPPEEEEIQAIHLESAVFDKVDFEAMTQPEEEDDIPMADEVAPPPDAKPAEFAPGDEVVTQILPGGFMPEMDDKVTQIISPDEMPGLREAEPEAPAPPEPKPAPAPAPPPAEMVGPRTVLLPEAVAQEILEEVNTSLESSYGNPQEGLEALGSAYRGLKEGLNQLVGDLRSLTGRDVGKVRDPGLQMEAVRGTIREVIEGLRKQARGDKPSGGLLGDEDLEDILVVIPKEVVDAVTEAGVGMEDQTAFLRALLERLGATARENLRHREEVEKLRSALETQFKITTQIREAWVKISKELAQSKAEAAARKA